LLRQAFSALKYKGLKPAFVRRKPTKLGAEQYNNRSWRTFFPSAGEVVHFLAKRKLKRKSKLEKV